MPKMSIALILATLFILILNSSLRAGPPSKEVLQRLKDEGRFEAFVEMMRDAKSRGVDSPRVDPSKGISELKGTHEDPYRVLVLLVDFPNKLYTGGVVAGTPADFDSILLSDGINPTGSMKEFYLENSYGNFVMEGDVFGWYTAENSYQYYVNFCDGSYGMGEYPNNSSKLAEEAILAADAEVDFSLYDNDGDGYVDGLFIVYAGTGSDATSNECDIWPHLNWLTFGAYVDGVEIREYSVEPEERSSGLTPIGVFCHEFGHVLGLPDLYDYDYSSNGVGNWALMGFGSWNGGSQTPSQLICWSKYQLGWLMPIDVTSNMTDVDFPAIETSPVSYRLWRDGIIGDEYFMVENRQRIGYDTHLPGEGMLIWHIDESQWGNEDEWHPLVMLEQADGQFDLQYGLGRGNASDAFPNSGNAPNFHDRTVPDTRDYDNLQTQVAVWGIPSPGPVMTVDLDVNWSRPYLALQNYLFSDVNGGDGDGLLEAGETIELICVITNDWKTANSVTMSLSVDDETVDIISGVASVGTIPPGGVGHNGGSPFVFDIPTDYFSRIDSFFIEITSDGGEFVVVLPIEQNVGLPPILLLDDDYGDSFETYYKNLWLEKRLPSLRWDKAIKGPPSAADLLRHDVVVWFTGYYRPNPLTAEDISAMKSYLDGGGNLFLTGQGIAPQLDQVDPAFLNDYLHAQYLRTLMMPLLVVSPGAQLFAEYGDSVLISGYGGASNQSLTDRFEAINGGSPELAYYESSELGAVSYSGSYKMVYFGFGFEAITVNPERFAMPDEIMDLIMNFFGLASVTGFPAVTDVAVGPGISTNLTDHTPEFSWVYFDEGGAAQVGFQIQVGTDNDWSITEMWNYTAGSGSGTSLEYAGLPLSDGQTCFYRIRVNNGLQWSNWMVDQFHVNWPPGVPTNLSPSGFVGMMLDSTDLVGSSVSFGDGAGVAYDFQLFDDDQLTNLITEVSGVESGSVTTSWTVDVSLVDGEDYYWRMRSFDSYEYSEWSETASFWINMVNSPPSSFDLMLPADGASLVTVLPTFYWGKSGAGDPHDSVNYTILIDTSLSFSNAEVAGPIGDTSYTLETPLTVGSYYYWMVLAEDMFGAQIESSSIFGMSSLVPGDANGDGGTNIGDAVFLINYVFKSGPPPIPLLVGDANGDCGTNVGDAVYLINYVFKGGPAPLVGCTP